MKRRSPSGAAALSRSAVQPQRHKKWDPQFYEAKHSVVFKAAADLVDLLAPAMNERILDLGCGPGHLTAEIAARGARVLGIDQSSEMIAQAKRNFPGLWFDVADATAYTTDEPFDAVFSNAALHWIKRPAEVIARVRDALRPGGRFVAEMGGKGNIGQIIEAARAALLAQGRLALRVDTPWFFPSVAEYATLLEGQGFDVTFAQLFDRPTKLQGESGMRDWITQFGSHMIDDLDEAAQADLFARVERSLRHTLYRDGAWTADYRRLRFVAVKPVAAA